MSNGKCPYPHGATVADAAVAGGAPAPIAPDSIAPAPTAAASTAMPPLLLPHDDHHDSVFDHPTASAYSCYSGPLPTNDHHESKGGTAKLYIIPPGKLWPDEHDIRVPPLAQVAHDQERAHILGEYYTCVGARAAFSQNTYRFGFYKDLAHFSSMLAMGRDLRRFVAEYEQLGQFTTFIAAFKYPQSTSEAEFEQLMWKHLQMLHDEDPSDWDPHYSADPMAPNFAFSFAGKAFFVVGKHSGASRFSRRLGFAALVFNPESQIRRLIEEGGLKKFADTVRRRDIKYQGDINPSLPADSSTTGGESRVYSGMTHRTGEPWQCPFHPKAEILAAEAARKTEAGSTAVPPVVATAAAPPASGEDDGAKKPQG